MFFFRINQLVNNFYGGTSFDDFVFNKLINAAA